MNLFDHPEEQPDYSEFEKLTEYERKRLVTNNYWRIRNGMNEIIVPDKYVNYHEAWKIEKIRALQHRKEHSRVGNSGGKT